MTGQSGNGTEGRPARRPVLAARARPFKLRHVLFVCLLLSGIIPLALSSVYLIRQNRDLLVQQEKEHLVRSAQAVTRQVDGYLARQRSELAQRGNGLLAVPGPEEPVARLRQSWVGRFLEDFRTANPDTVALRVLDPAGQGVRLEPELAARVERAREEAFVAARDGGAPVYRMVVEPGANEPRVVLAVPVPGGDGGTRLIVESVTRLPLAEAVFGGAQQMEVAVLLVGRDDEVLWSEGGDPGLRAAVADSKLLAGLAQNPLHLTQPLSTTLDGRERTAEATVSLIAETGWRVVVVKPVPAAFAAVDRMIYNTALSSVLLVLLAGLFAAVVARWMGRPIQRLAESSHQIAAGNFGQRVDPQGLAFEMADLARDFNRMSGHVESYVEQLRAAAQANRDLFIGAIRAFAAAIDAKDPYTRGHSDRVAAASRTIARHLGMDDEFQQQVWLGALLHDVGKIGVDDRILKKGGLLTEDEFEQMKQHTVIGAQIMGRISQLREVIPAIRWHHENWNGRGYPDGVKGEEIPLIARIVAVADTFDAVTTSRPYQEAFTLDFAVETITKLTGARFDAKVVTAFLKAVKSGEVQAASEGSAARPRPKAAAAGAPVLT